MKKFILPIIALLALTSCATRYGPQNSWGFGYTDQMLKKDTFIVRFDSNAGNTSKKVAKYALRRAAEITVKNGFKYFTISNLHNDTSVMKVGSNYVTLPGVSFKIKCYLKKPKQHEPANEDFIVNTTDFLITNGHSVADEEFLVDAASFLINNDYTMDAKGTPLPLPKKIEESTEKTLQV